MFRIYTILNLVLISLFIQPAQANRWNPDDHKNFSRQEIQYMIIEEALKNGVVPPSLALAVAKVESDFQAGVTSSAGARGVMQIMPATARGEFGVGKERLFDPKVNIRLGIRFLNQLYNQYGQKWNLALSHYNGGTLKGRGGHAIPHSYTRKYVTKVMKYWRYYTKSQLVLAAKNKAGHIAVATKNNAGSNRYTNASRYSTSSTHSWVLEEKGVSQDWQTYLSVANDVLNKKSKGSYFFDGEKLQTMEQVDRYKNLREGFRTSLQESENKYLAEKVKNGNGRFM